MATDAIRQIDPSSDLGFGGIVSSRRGYRLVNRDGSFNVRVAGKTWWQSVFGYQSMITMRWPQFFGVIALGYLVLNTMFAAAYLVAGPEALQGDTHLSAHARAFFFSVHTFATIGYGNVSPVSFAANVIVTIESLVGLTAMALATGLVFARFSRPIPDVRYSKKAVIAPYGKGTAFEFRVVNAGRTQLMNVHAVVMVSRFEDEGERRKRRFHVLSLERKSIALFPLNWTVVHPIDESSPLWGWDKQRLIDADAEFLILLTGTDESFAQTVHSRSSYSAHEVEFGYRFEMMYSEAEQSFVIDLEKLDHVVPAA